MSSIYILVASYINMILPILFVVIGFIGNSIVFFILAKPKFLQETTFRYLMVVEIVDSIWIVGTLLPWISALLDQKKFCTSCKIFAYIAYFTASFYHWLYTLIAVDRLMSIKFSKRFVFRKKFIFQILALLVILIAASAANVPHFLFKYYSNGTNNSLQLQNDLDAYYLYLESISATILVPFIIRMLCLILILFFLIKQKRRANGQQNQGFNREVQIMKNICAMDIWFLFCSIPANVNEFFQSKFIMDNISYDFWPLFSSLIAIFPLIQASCNFFIYLSFNTRFRKEFFKMMNCCCCRKSIIVNHNLS